MTSALMLVLASGIMALLQYATVETNEGILSSRLQMQADNILDDPKVRETILKEAVLRDTLEERGPEWARARRELRHALTWDRYPK